MLSNKLLKLFNALDYKNVINKYELLYIYFLVWKNSCEILNYYEKAINIIENTIIKSYFRNTSFSLNYPFLELYNKYDYYNNNRNKNKNNNNNIVIPYKQLNYSFKKLINNCNLISIKNTINKKTKISFILNNYLININKTAIHRLIIMLYKLQINKKSKFINKE